MLTSGDEGRAPTLRGLRPLSELAANRPHGDRLRYMAGCHCAECRRANCDYEKQRVAARAAGDWNGIVPAQRARAHLLELRAAGVGRRQVADASGVGEVIVANIGIGSRLNIRARTERAILAVTAKAVADGALVDARPTWKRLNQLLAWGYTKAHLARELGYERAAIQIGRKQCTARNAYDVERVHERLRRVPHKATARLLADLSSEGYRQSQIDRLLADLAAREGRPAPDLTVHAGRFVDAVAADLVRRLHGQLLEVPA
jgi:hypothetical protein